MGLGFWECGCPVSPEAAKQRRWKLLDGSPSASVVVTFLEGPDAQTISEVNPKS